MHKFVRVRGTTFGGFPFVFHENKSEEKEKEKCQKTEEKVKEVKLEDCQSEEENQ